MGPARHVRCLDVPGEAFCDGEAGVVASVAVAG
jgi:hypothetical protein